MAETETQEYSLEDKGQYDFIKGEFSPQDTREIIEHISKMINFHKLKSWSHDIKFGVADQRSLDRIEELKACEQSIREHIQLAKELGKTIRIQSQINIELI
jgi:hypothetical protein